MDAIQLKKIREKLKMTQGELALSLGYANHLAILRKENGISPITRQDEIILELKYHDTICKLNIYINA